MPASARPQAVHTLIAVLGERRSLNHALPLHTSKIESAAERALSREIIFGVMRWLPRLQFLLTHLLQKPLKRKDIDIQCVLLIGLYQLAFMHTKEHAAVNETVELTRLLKKTWATRLVNGVLRRYQREHNEFDKLISQEPEALWAHPAWFIGMLKKYWPAHWEKILDANNQHAPMVLRVNRQKIAVCEYLQQLSEQGLDAQTAPYGDTAIILKQGADVQRLPGFNDGLVSVQDSAAQLAAGLLDLQPGQRVLDACAAPGGKTAHILETEPQLAQVVAIDNKAKRLDMIRDTLSRLDLNAELVAADAAEPEDWWDGKSFDRILLDAPCSATGVIRRNPDIKFFRQPEDIDSLVQQQAHLLNNLWPLLAKGGRLVYATCSILPRENSRQIAGFLKQHPDAQEITIAAEWGTTCEYGRQILTGQDGMDGFYYACVQKR